MPTNNPLKMTLGSDLTDAQLARANKYQKEMDTRNELRSSDPGDGDKPADGHDDNVPGGDTLPADGNLDNGDSNIPAAEDGIPLATFLADNKTDKQALLNQLLDDPDTHLTLKGKRGERKTSYADIKSEIERGRSSQSKLNMMSKSEEMKLGTLFAAAKGGDKGAQKEAFKMLKEFSGTETEEGFLDNMDQVEEKFDPDKKMAEVEEAQKWEDAFPQELKDSVDYQPTLDKMRATLRGDMPEKVFDSYDSNPVQRKIMYDLVAQGHAEKAMELFYEKYKTLPFEEQLRLDNDPAAWGTAFSNVFKSMKRETKPAPENVEPKEDSSDLVDSMSAGNTSRTRAPEVKKSYLKMTSKEFAVEKARLLGRN